MNNQLERLLAQIASQEMDTLEWLKTNCPEVFEEQKHLDDKSSERAYWHYGRWSALKDIRQSPMMALLREMDAGIKELIHAFEIINFRSAPPVQNPAKEMGRIFDISQQALHRLAALGYSHDKGGE